MMVYAVACYIAGLLVFPFFWTFASGRSAADPDEPLLLFASVFWPVSLIVAFVFGCWSVMIVLGSRARRQFDQAWKDFAGWVRES